MDIEILTQKFNQQRNDFNKNPYPSYKTRIDNLNKLYRIIVKYEKEIVVAIKKDFGHRSPDETRLFEILPILSLIKYNKKNLKKWMKPSKRKVSLMFQPGQSKVIYQPLGVIGVIVPWNYPLFLSLGPLTQIISAGNRATIKMSEYTPNFSELLTKIIGEVFSENEILIVNGDSSFAEEFTKLKFDHLVFTGATSIAKNVMRAASNHLVPLTLELGGKSPVIISNICNLEDAAARVAFGKTVNAGQTCIAPDYVYIHESVKSEFIKYYVNFVKEFFPDSLKTNDDSTAIINRRQFVRLESYLDDAISKKAHVINIKGEIDDKKLSHYIVDNVDDSMLLMQNEIFGPILPIKTYQNIDEVINYICENERPLALYYFGNNKYEQELVLKHTHSGGVSINETLLHAGQDDMPFGGVGHSGMGHYHGYEGFLSFSHAKSIFIKSRFSVMRIVYPPYNKFIHKIIYKLFLK